MSKKVLVHYDIIDAWESWYAEVPDDAPDNTEDLLIWVNNHPDEVEFTSLEDSGNYGMEALEVEVKDG